uniref:MULE transposase domain-containing protein n=1 Tax=Ditylenchus dipsaci TaxID=166011 RepID=A0A915E5P3_9BILA
MNWHGFPVCGFSDAEQHFFATHLALVSNENTWCYERFFEAISALNYIPEIIMGDGDTTISAAAKNVWMLIKRAMCYAHVKTNLKKKLQPKVMDPVRETISRDVALFQLASSTADDDQYYDQISVFANSLQMILVASMQDAASGDDFSIDSGVGSPGLKGCDGAMFKVSAWKLKLAVRLPRIISSGGASRCQYSYVQSLMSEIQAGCLYAENMPL